MPLAGAIAAHRFGLGAPQGQPGRFGLCAIEISERHRHRYEVNVGYVRQLAEHGFVVSGWSPDGRLPEIMEITDHPWFIGVQFHPELKSRPLSPHPLFASFIAAAVQNERLV